MAKKKKKVEKPRHEPTKRQRSRFKQHQRRQRIIYGAGILIIVAVLAVIGAGVYFGWYVSDVKPLQETVIRVNDTEFSMDYYVKALKHQVIWLGSIGLDVELTQMPGLAEGMVTGIQTNELVRQEAIKLGITVSDEEIETEIKKDLIRQEVRQEAAEEGITISDEEVEARVEEELGDKDLSSLEPYITVIKDVRRVQMLQEKLLDEYFDQQVPQSADQRHIMAMFLESQVQASEVRERLEAGELFSEVAAELCLDSYCKSQEGDLGWQSRDTLSGFINSSVLEDSAFSAEVRVLSQPIYEETKIKYLGYWLVEVEFVDAEVEHAQLKLILLGSEQEANEIRARLEAGEDFAALAEEFSQHDVSKENGGEFELNSKGRFAPAFDEFVFDPELELGALSQPIRDDTISTEGGYWLIKVVDADDDRQLEEEARDTLKRDALDEWQEGLAENPDNTVESYLDEEKTNWAIMHVWEG